MDADNEQGPSASPGIANRFRSFLPVVVDIETGGLNASTDAVLQLAAVILRMDGESRIFPAGTYSTHVEAFDGANIDPKSLELNRIDPDHPLRMAKPEDEALRHIFRPIRREIRETGCTRAILVGHNSWFDLGFLNAALTRTGIRRNPFHPFSSFDTATLGGLAFGQTVLARAVKACGVSWDGREAHSAIYDAEKTAELFCAIVNRWDELNGFPEYTVLARG